MERRKYKYIYFGAKIESEIEFENLNEKEFDNPEVRIRFTDEYKENEFKLGLTVKEDKIICKKRDYTVAVISGKYIEISGEITEKEPWLRHILLESWMMYLWLQRGCLVFHGSVCECNGRAVVFMGDGGAGKSTLSYYLTKHGYKKMSDDLAIIFKDEKGEYNVIPSSIKQNLTKESIDIFNLNSDKMDKMAGEEKYTFFINEICNEMKKAAIIFIIEKSCSSEMEFSKITGFSKLSYLLNHIQQLGNIREIEKGSRRHMKIAGEFASAVEMYKIRRPEGKNTLEEIYKIVEECQGDKIFVQG